MSKSLSQKSGKSVDGTKLKSLMTEFFDLKPSSTKIELADILRMYEKAISIRKDLTLLNRSEMSKKMVDQLTIFQKQVSQQLETWKNIFKTVALQQANNSQTNLVKLEEIQSHWAKAIGLGMSLDFSAISLIIAFAEEEAFERWMKKRQMQGTQVEPNFL